MLCTNICYIYICRYRRYNLWHSPFKIIKEKNNQWEARDWILPGWCWWYCWRSCPHFHRPSHHPTPPRWPAAAPLPLGTPGCWRHPHCCGWYSQGHEVAPGPSCRYRGYSMHHCSSPHSQFVACSSHWPVLMGVGVEGKMVQVVLVAEN